MNPTQAGSEGSPVQRAGVGLCLSGGGYRAMLFHTGVLWRLNDLGWLPKLGYVSSVSGGSITAGALAYAWPKLAFADGVATNFTEAVVGPVRALARRNLDIRVILRGLVKPWRSVGEELARSFARHLFGDLTVPELPEEPRFVFNATNLQDGERWWFYRREGHEPIPADAKTPAISLATAVAASAAFPPFLSPVVVPTGQKVPGTDRPEKVVLGDAGVYDNLGLDPVIGRCEIVLVSDASQRMEYLATVPRDWPRHLLRAVDVIHNQVGQLRKRALVKSYVDGDYHGAYWAIHSDIANFGLDDVLASPESQTLALATVRTRLDKTPAVVQQRLINWGYAICDAGMRRWVDRAATPPEAFPYPEVAVG